MSGHIYISYFAKKCNNKKMTLCSVDCNFQFHISKLTAQRASHSMVMVLGSAKSEGHHTFAFTCSGEKM